MRLQTPLLALVGRDEMPESSSLSLIAKKRRKNANLKKWLFYAQLGDIFSERAFQI